MILVSTAGFSYDDWLGRFYPAGLKKQEQLPYFAQYFNAVELNYTYYSPPGEKGIAGHLRNAPGMRFALKAHGCFTHKRKYGERERDIYRAALAQLREHDALVALLLQFPYSFHATVDNLSYLETLLRDFEGFPLAVEFRYGKWKNRKVYTFLRERGAALVTTDAPELGNLFRGGWEAVGPFSYIRLHGRNAAKWWEHEQGWERYDYLYTPAEIDGMAVAIRKLAVGEDRERASKKKSPRDVYIFFNNHWQAQGAINALQLAERLGLKLPEQLPEYIRKRLADTE